MVKGSADNGGEEGGDGDRLTRKDLVEAIRQERRKWEEATMAPSEVEEDEEEMRELVEEFVHADQVSFWKAMVDYFMARNLDMTKNRFGTTYADHISEYIAQEIGGRREAAVAAKKLRRKTRRGKKKKGRGHGAAAKEAVREMGESGKGAVATEELRVMGSASERGADLRVEEPRGTGIRAEGTKCPGSEAGLGEHAEPWPPKSPRSVDWDFTQQSREESKEDWTAAEEPTDFPPQGCEESKEDWNCSEAAQEEGTSRQEAAEQQPEKWWVTEARGILARRAWRAPGRAQWTPSVRAGREYGWVKHMRQNAGRGMGKHSLLGFEGDRDEDMEILRQLRAGGYTESQGEFDNPCYDVGDWGASDDEAAEAEWRVARKAYDEADEEDADEDADDVT